MEHAARTNLSAGSDDARVALPSGATEDEPEAAPRGPSSAARPAPSGRSPAPGGRLRAPTPRAAAVLVAVGIGATVLLAAGDAVGPFIFGLLLAYLLDPLVERFARLGLPRWLAVLLVYLLAIGAVALVIALTVPPLVRQIGTFADQLPTIVRQIQYQLGHLTQLYDRLGLPTEIRSVANQIVKAAVDAVQNLDLGVIRPIIASAAGFISSIFGYLILPAWLFYLLKDRPRLQVAFDRSLPPGWRTDVWAIAGIAHEVFGKWIRGQIILGSTVGIASFVGLTFLGFAVDPIFAQYAVLLALIAGFGELIPIIGPIITAVPAVLLGLTAGAEPAIAALILYFGIQQVENNVLVPKIQSDAIRLHPTVIIVALVVGGSIFGLLGAVLALPVTAAFRDVFAYVFRRAGEAAGEADEGAASSARPDIAGLEASGAESAVATGAEVFP
jgi:predicted PurR-regulated permease PerM